MFIPLTVKGGLFIDDMLIFLLFSHFPVQAGTTAFLDGAKIYSLLSAEQKLMVENSKASPSASRASLLHSVNTNLSFVFQVVYAPHPFRKHAAVRGRSNGLGQWSEDLEAPLEDLPPWEEEDVLTYPMLWTNPKTGEKALQSESMLFRGVRRNVLIPFISISTVHSIATWKLMIKTSPDAEERVVDDIEEVRRIIYELQRPALEPKYIFAPPYIEGDLVIFYNRGLMHCATGKRSLL